MIATAIITAHRPIPTLRRSIESFRAAGFSDCYLHVSSDGIQHEQYFIRDHAISSYKSHMPPLGNFRNWVDALRTIFERTDCQWLMVCEDDIEWAINARHALMQDLRALVGTHLYRDSGALSLYCPINMSRELERGNDLSRGWYRGMRKGMKTWGAQCLVFSREHARMLLSDRQFMSMQNDRRWQKNVDGIVAKCINDNARVISYRIPCLVDHTFGAGNSSLGYADDRPNLRTKYFTGEA